MMNHRKHILCMALLCFIVCGGMLYDAAAAENRGYAAPANALPKDLKGVTVKDYFIPANVREVGSLQTVMAHVVVARGDLSQAYFAAGGDKLYEKDIIFTLKDSKCRIKLHNDDIITLGDNTRLAVKEATGSRDTPEKKSAMALARGKAMFYAIRLLKHKGLSMTVESPTATAGVRGTKFGMEVTVEEEKTVGALPLLLADSSENWGRHLILAQQMPPPSILGRVTTTVHGFDGTVAVTSAVTGGTTTVGAGQTLSSSGQGLGSLIPTPPQVSQRFQSQTNVPPPAGGSTEGGQTAGGGGGSSQPPGGGSQTTGGTSAPLGTTGGQTTPPDLTSITQTQLTQTVETSSKVDNVTDPKTNASGKNVGYFASLLKDVSGGKLGGVFISRNRYDGDGNIWARSLTNPEKDFMRAQGSSGFKSTPYVKFLAIGDIGSGDLGANNPVTSTTLGSNSYQEWGYATVPQSISVGSNSYLNDNRTYWIFGYNSPALSGFSGTASYSGKAYGTYWTASGGIDMTGSFSTSVNFTSASLSSFSLNVSGSGRSASISGASGSIAADNTFSVGGGTWNLNGTTPDYQKAYGSFYGPGTAATGPNYIGGPWAMYNSSLNTGAVGIFQGAYAAPSLATQYGHFAGLLQNCSVQYVDSYMTDSTQNFKSNNAYAMNNNLTWSTQIDGSGTGKNMVELGVVGQGSAWTGSAPVTFTRLGANAYMEWGTWTQPAAMYINGTNYYFKNEGAYVWGDPTTADQMATLKTNSIQGTYSGNAFGTFFSTANTGTQLTGTFSGSINFASPAVTDFNVSVTGAGSKSVTISGATGTFSASTSTFTINPATGTWVISDGSTPAAATIKGATGTVFNNGNGVGGAWKAGRTGTSIQAVGGFVGTKQATGY